MPRSSCAQNIFRFLKKNTIYELMKNTWWKHEFGNSFCNCSCGLTDIFSPFPKKQWILKVQKEILEHINFSLIALKANVPPSLQLPSKATPPECIYVHRQHYYNRLHQRFPIPVLTHPLPLYQSFHHDSSSNRAYMFYTKGIKVCEKYI